MVRKHPHKIGVRDGFSVVFSPEEVDDSHVLHVDGERFKRSTVGTIFYMFAIFGCFLALPVIRQLLK